MHRFDVKANRLNAVYLVTKDTYVKANPRIRLNVENKTLSERLHKRVQYPSTKEFALTSDLVRYIYIYICIDSTLKIMCSTCTVITMGKK